MTGYVGGTLAGQPLTGTANGVGFSAFGFTVPDILTPETVAQATWNGVGFGVIGFGSDTTIDGEGIDKNELLRLVFDKPVTLTSISFGGLGAIDDVFIAVTGQPGQRYGNVGGSPNPPSTALLTNPLHLSLFGTSFDIVAGFPNPACAIPGGDCGGANDSFQVTGLEVQPVPLPAAGWLLLAGVGGLAALRRRRETA